MKKVIRVLPIAAAVALILFLTLQNTTKNVALSESFRVWLVNMYMRLGIDPSDAWWNSTIGVRRLGHVIEYFVLGVASVIFMKRKIWAAVFCLLISVLDQCLKRVLPIRHFDIYDIGFDMTGAIVGIILFAIAGYVYRIILMNRERKHGYDEQDGEIRT